MLKREKYDVEIKMDVETIVTIVHVWSKQND